MNFVGTCPACNESIDFGGYLPPAGRCGHCQRRFTVLVPELEGVEDAELEVVLLAMDSEPLPEPILLSGQLLVVGLAGLLALIGLGSLVGAVYVRQDPLPPPLGFAVAIFAFGLACLGGAGLILWSLYGPRRPGARR